MVSLSACAAYFVITLVFAAAFVVIGHHKPDCIQVAGQPFSSDGAYLDAFALSWTTFSTVVCGMLVKESCLLRACGLLVAHSYFSLLISPCPLVSLNNNDK